MECKEVSILSTFFVDKFVNILLNKNCVNGCGTDLKYEEKVRTIFQTKNYDYGITYFKPIV